mgnify:CR=1 FL=1
MTGVLRGKIALVTGGATGIGHAICEQLAIEGASVALIDINRDAGETAALALQRHGVESAFFYCDVSDEQQISAMVTAVLERFGRLDIACNNAALSRGSGPIHQFSRAVFDQTLEMCLTNTWLCMKYELEAMLEVIDESR